MLVIDNKVVTNISTERAKRFGAYPDSFTKLHNREAKEPARDEFTRGFTLNKELFKTILDSGATLSCTAGYFRGGCVNGHKFVKAVFCGREWCESCGQDGSPVHLRRMARWMPKVKQIDSMAYMVITIPEEVRSFFKTKESLSDFRTFVKRRLQRDGYKRGLIRYHYFGDCKLCKAKGCHYCNSTGISAKYHPHLNVFVEGGKIAHKDFQLKFADLRESLSQYFKSVSGIKGLQGNVHYQYTDSAAKKMHLLKYVTRSTHRNYVKAIELATKIESLEPRPVPKFMSEIIELIKLRILQTNVKHPSEVDHIEEIFTDMTNALKRMAPTGENADAELIFDCMILLREKLQ